MENELTDNIFSKADIGKAFNWGLEIGLTVFEESLCLSNDDQKIILGRLKDILRKAKNNTV